MWRVWTVGYRFHLANHGICHRAAVLPQVSSDLRPANYNYPPPPSLRWEEKGYFKPNPNATGPPVGIAMPPPNVTGRLHMGHAMTVGKQLRGVTTT